MLERKNGSWESQGFAVLPLSTLDKETLVEREEDNFGAGKCFSKLSFYRLVPGKAL